MEPVLLLTRYRMHRSRLAAAAGFERALSGTPSGSFDRLEVVLLEVMNDSLAEHGALGIGLAEVNAGPHSGVDDLLERLRQPIKAARSTGFVAEGTEGNLVGAEEGLGRMNKRASPASVSRWMVGEWRRNERWWGEYRCGGVE